MQQSHEEDRGGGAGAGGAGAEFDETPERSLTTEAVSEAKSLAPSIAASAGATWLPTEVRNRLDELEEEQRKASWLRPANWPRLFAKLAMGKLGAVLGTTLLMKPLCSAACAPEMVGSWDGVPGLAPVWKRVCG